MGTPSGTVKWRQTASGWDIEIAESSQIQFWLYNSGTSNALDYFGMSCRVSFVDTTDGGTFTSSINEFVSQTVVRSRFSTIDDGGVNKFRFNQYTSGSGVQWKVEPVHNEFLSGEPFNLGYSVKNDTDEGYMASYINGHHALHVFGNISETGTGVNNLARPLLKTSSQFKILIHITDDTPIRIYNTDPSAEAEFLPDRSVVTYENIDRPFYGAGAGSWDVATTGNGSVLSKQIVPEGSGVIPERASAVISGDSGDTITFTLRSAHAIGAPNKRGTSVPLRCKNLRLPSGASGIFRINGDSLANPIRIKIDGTSGSASSRPVEFDPGTGVFASTGINLDESHHHEMFFILREGTGKGSLIFHDLTEIAAGVKRWHFARHTFDGLLSNIDEVEFECTMGTSGECEFEGIENPTHITLHGVSSYTSSNATSDTSGETVSTANGFGANGFGQSSHRYWALQSRTWCTANPQGRQGRALSTLVLEINGFGITGLLPHLEDQAWAVTEWQANDQWADVSTYFEPFIDGCNTYGVEMLWATQLPVDDDPASDQDLVRANNDRLVAYLTSVAGAGTIWLSDIAALYSDAAAAALSSDNTHINLGFPEVAPLIEANAVLLVAAGNTFAPVARMGGIQRFAMSATTSSQMSITLSGE